ncbi:MAG: 2-amino-4-hydroxy-6-hydroxymethyldihydropteridine diphosphokinase [Firmicutes bacterium]|nr:2-amino-4-hydroxy-6-hydroxymethyldihydropteridine diphosphokinase [Bacillota bacterium]
MNKEIAFLGLGSNMGDKEGNIKKALEMLKDESGIDIERVAPFYRTAPVGYTQQDWFLNTVAQIQTTLKPDNLLAQILWTEDFLGRKRQIRWGPRVVDLDILMYGLHVIREPGLEVPHPRMLERAFVMVPLADLAPDLLLPGGKTAEEIAKELKGLQEIELLG